jgi:hypothetical protein
MKVLNQHIAEVSAGGKTSLYKLRVIMGYIDRKPQIHFNPVREMLECFKPKLSDHDTRMMSLVLKRKLIGSEDYMKKGVEKEQVDQFVTLNTIFVKGIQVNKIGEFAVHLPIYQITYGNNELGFSFYISANKPVFI